MGVPFRSFPPSRDGGRVLPFLRRWQQLVVTSKNRFSESPWPVFLSYQCLIEPALIAREGNYLICVLWTAVDDYRTHRPRKLRQQDNLVVLDKVRCQNPKIE